MRSEETKNISNMLWHVFNLLRCGSAGAVWRFTPALMWATCSLKRPLTRDPTSCRIPYELQRFGWTLINNTSTTGTPQPGR